MEIWVLVIYVQAAGLDWIFSTSFLSFDACHQAAEILATIPAYSNNVCLPLLPAK